MIEDLNVAGMVQNENLAKAISDASFGEFFRQMKYKCDWYGKSLIVIDRFAPSSKRCSDCGIINDQLTLADREWGCSCGSTHDRDINAAINIKFFGIEIHSRRGAPGELAELSGIPETMKQEAGKGKSLTARRGRGVGVKSIATEALKQHEPLKNKP